MALRASYDCVFGSGGTRDGYNLFENPVGAPLRSGYDSFIARGSRPLTLGALSFTGVVYAGLFRSGIDIGTSSVSRNIWSSRTGEMIGALVDDPDQDLGLGANGTFIDRMRWNNGDDWVLNHSNTDRDGNAAALNLSTWATGGGSGKKGYIAKGASDYVDFDVGETDIDGRWVAGDVWARWEAADNTARKVFIQGIRSNDLFAFVIAD